jgi:cell fate (sporulation/competence/biofilm development) regulator YmcA (YheA/YmcA/DUF963 family)
MAAGKKSFVLYCDLIHTITKMPSDKAGDLFKHILAYVNDENPITNDLIIELTFEPIKQQLKRDLDKWENEIKPQRSEAGRLGGLKSGEARRSKLKQNEANALNLKQNEANEAVNVNVSVNDNVRKDISQTPLIDIEKIFLEKTESNWTESYAKKEAQKFYNFYGSKGWKVGKEKMKSLPHAIGGWISRCDKPETKDSPKEETEREFRLRMFNERNGL